jgi:apolipoprotein N-acyltransferase
LVVALIQGSVDTSFEDDAHPFETHLRYLELSKDALKAEPEVRLIIWPESMYWQYEEPAPERDSHPNAAQTADEYFRARADAGALTAQWMSRELKVPFIVGCPEFDEVAGQLLRFNSAWLIDGQGRRSSRYDKMHPVMFGEYIPLGNLFPWLYTLTPMGDGLTSGRQPRNFEVEGVRFCPCICFENTVPHLIRRQVWQLADQNQPPDVLVTLTNDGWFWGSSLLDHHLTCGVFRAVELRRPLLIAANTGFSAWIDEYGRVLAKGPRRAEGRVVARVSRRPEGESLYFYWGELLAGACLAASAIASIGAIVMPRTAKQAEA